MNVEVSILSAHKSREQKSPELSATPSDEKHNFFSTSFLVAAQVHSSF